VEYWEGHYGEEAQIWQIKNYQMIQEQNQVSKQWVLKYKICHIYQTFLKINNFLVLLIENMLLDMTAFKVILVYINYNW
jgi:hypothetical protein